LAKKTLDNKECVVAKLHSLLEKFIDILIRPFWEKNLYNLMDPSAQVIFVPDKVHNAISILMALILNNGKAARFEWLPGVYG